MDNRPSAGATTPAFKRTEPPPWDWVFEALQEIRTKGERSLSTIEKAAIIRKHSASRAVECMFCRTIEVEQTEPDKFHCRTCQATIERRPGVE